MDEYITHLHRTLEVLNPCVSLSKVSTNDAYFVTNAHAKLVDASEHQRGVDELCNKLEVLKLCVSLSKVSTDDAYFLKNAHAKLVDASAHQRRIDELFKQYEQLKEQEAKILADLQVRVELAECQRSFIESLPPKSQPTGTATQGSSLAAGDKGSRRKVTAASKNVTNFVG
ncbi:hypothetical protein MRX96_006666 [Rhipicephalus microplus]